MPFYFTIYPFESVSDTLGQIFYWHSTKPRAAYIYVCVYQLFICHEGTSSLQYKTLILILEVERNMTAILTMQNKET